MDPPISQKLPRDTYEAAHPKPARVLHDMTPLSRVKRVVLLPGRHLQPDGSSWGESFLADSDRDLDRIIPCKVVQKDLQALVQYAFSMCQAHDPDSFLELAEA